MNGVDIILDMMVGTEDKMTPSQTVPAHQPLPFSIYPDQTKHSTILKKNWSQLNIIKASFSNFSIKKVLIKKINFLKKWTNELNKKEHVNYDVTAAAVVNMENIVNLCRHSLDARYSTPVIFEPYANNKKTFSSLGNSSEADFTDKKHFVNMVSDENEENNADFSKNGLRLFFDSLLKSTSEFTEEELLELQIQILKTVKNIKGKRDLKQNLRKYSSSLGLKDSLLFCSDFKTSIHNILL